MQNGLNAADSNPPATFSESQERSIVWLLCLLAPIPVFVFSAAAPFFNNVDEQIHLDLAVKYSQGHIPRSLEPVSAEVVPYATLYGSPEYVGIPANFPGGQFPPPPWMQPLEKVRPALIAKTAVWRAVTNYEAAQPPLYYTLAALWWRLGKVCGFHDGRLLYWLRFLKLLVVAILVCGDLRAARLVLPICRFLRLGVPALLAFIPQSAFYSIQNDVLSPLAFGAAFILLVRLLRAEIPGVRLGTLTGLALAATFLPKISNLPLLAVSGTGAIVFCGKKRYQLIASKKYDGTGRFGFTLIRKHPLSEAEMLTRKNTWYEYLKVDGEILSFPIETLDLGLKDRLFKTGTVIKLYSYDLPGGARSVISRDLNQSINEFLFEPALPIYTIDKPERYPLDKNLARELFGLKRRLELDDSKYIEDSFQA